MDILSYHSDLLKIRYQRTKPQFVEHPDSIEVVGSKGDSCFICKEDADLAVNYAWYSTNGYFYRHTSRSNPTRPNKSLYLHPLVLERKLNRPLEPGELCDHIDWDKTNNRRANLRLASKAENAYNAQIHEDSQSQYKGVSKAVDTYRVQIQYSVTVSQTGFRCPVEAARSYDSLAAEHHGKFAVFNFPQEWVYDLEQNKYIRLER